MRVQGSKPLSHILVGEQADSRRGTQSHTGMQRGKSICTCAPWDGVNFHHLHADVMKQVDPGLYYMNCMPLKIKSSDGALARVHLVKI